MSGVAITDLPLTTTATLSDSMVIVQHGTPDVTKQATLATTFAVLNGATITGPFGVTNPGTASVEVVNFAQFAPAASANGSINLPGGVTWQWGIADTSTGGSVTVTFPTPFSAAAWSVTCIPNNQATLSTALMTITGFATAAQFTACAVAPTSISPLPGTTFYWMAIGPT